MRIGLLPAAMVLVIAGIARARTVRIQFETGIAALARPSEQALADVGAELLEVIAREPGAVLRITGHTDNVGSREINLDLSRKRAESVRDFLIGRFKLSPTSLAAVGAGPDKPVASNETEDGKRQNRRTEMEIVMPAEREPDASVEWLHRGVEISKAGEVDWLPVEAGTTLFRLYRVRTQDQSWGGLSFRRGGELTMGPSTLVTVFGGVGEIKERLKDGKYHLDLLSGELWVTLAGTPAEAHRIRMPTAEIESFSNRNWVGISDEKAALVSIYEGAADVVTQGRRVKVEKGFGVRVPAGQPPETLRPLPAAPSGVTVDDDGAVRPGGKARLRWTGSSPRYMVQVASDARFRSMVVYAEAGGPELEVDLADGPAWVRVLGVDGVGLKGEFSEPMAIAVRHVAPVVASRVRTPGSSLSLLYGVGAGAVMGSRANLFGFQMPLPRFGVMLAGPSGLEYTAEFVGLSLWPDDPKLRVKRAFGMFLGGVRSFSAGSGLRPFVGMKLGYMEFPAVGRRVTSEMAVGLEAGVRRKVWGPFTAFVSLEGGGALLPRSELSSVGVGLGFVVN